MFDAIRNGEVLNIMLIKGHAESLRVSCLKALSGSHLTARPDNKYTTQYHGWRATCVTTMAKPHAFTCEWDFVEVTAPPSSPEKVHTAKEETKQLKRVRADGAALNVSL